MSAELKCRCGHTYRQHAYGWTWSGLHPCNMWGCECDDYDRRPAESRDE